MSVYLDHGDCVLHHGDALATLREMPSASVHCIVTSPPFWALRDYGVDGQIGLEGSPSEWCDALVGVFREARRVLRPDGVAFIEVGDSYASAALHDAVSSGTACTQPPGSQDPGSAYHDPSDERAASPSHRSPRTDQPHPGSPEHHEPTSRDRSRSDSAAVDAGAAPRDAQASTTHDGGPAPHPTSSESAAASPQQPPTPHGPSELDEPHPGRTEQSIHGTSGTSEPSAGCTSGTELSSKASRNHTSASLIKPKDLVGAPWLLAFALRADGWYLRAEQIWHKANAMPESVTDRPTRAHSTVFLLSKSARYFFDSDAIREPADTTRRRDPSTWEERKAGGATRGNVAFGGNEGTGTQRGVHGEGISHDLGDGQSRNARSVWTIAAQPTPFAHFAVFPEALAARCILAGCPEGGTVLDPFAGSATTLLVARRHGRRSVGIELSAEYLAIAATRLQQLSLLGGDAA